MTLPGEPLRRWVIVAVVSGVIVGAAMAVGVGDEPRPRQGFSVSPEDEPHTHVWLVLENEGRSEVRAEVTFVVKGSADASFVTVPAGGEREVEGPTLTPEDSVGVNVAFSGVRASSTVPYARCPEGDVYLTYIVAPGSVRGPDIECR